MTAPPGPSINQTDPRFESAQRFEMLYRPIVFHAPHRTVHPSSWLGHIPFAFWIVDVLRPRVLVELGTHSGNSYAAFAQAIQTLELPTAAYAVDTWEGDSQAGFYGEDVYSEWSAYHEQHFASFSRLVRTTFEDAVHHFPDGSIDLLHLDGCHIYESVVSDFALWRPKLSERGVVLFHDINVRERDFGAWRLWEELKAQQLSTFEFLHGHGLGVLGIGPQLPDGLRWLFAAGENPQDTHAVREFFSVLGGTISARQQESETASRLTTIVEETAARLSAAEAVASQRDAELSARAAVVSRLSDELGAARADAEAARAEVVDARRASDQRDAQLAAARAERKRLEAVLEAKDRARMQVVAELRQLRHRVTDVEREAGLRAHQGVARAAIHKVEGRVRRGLRRVRTVARTMAALGMVPLRRRGLRGSSLKVLLFPQRLRDALVVMASELFDEAYYLGTNADVAASGVAPLAHFVLGGGVEGRSPHPLFDGDFYLRHNADVAAAGVNPLVHYRRRGAAEGRSPHALFNVPFYLQNNPDGHGRMEPLAHFLRFGAMEGRDPNPMFDCAFYLREQRDVARKGTNPLVHFVLHGWREGRRPSPGFDPAYYLRQYEDVAQSTQNPLSHYLESGRDEGRRATSGDDQVHAEAEIEPRAIALTARPLMPGDPAPPTIVCLSHVMPFPPRAGNEYRIFRLLRWFRDRGYRIVPVIAPLPGERVEPEAVRCLAAEFTNAVLCHRDGRLDYILGNVPDVLKSLTGEVTRPVSVLLDEPPVRDDHRGDLLGLDRTFCHDVMISAVTRLQQALGPHVLLAEYIWMTRILPLVPDHVVKVVDTHDVFSTKRDKVLRFGVDDLNVEPAEEANRLSRADLVVAIQDDERRELQRIVPGIPVVTAGVDFDCVDDPGAPSGQRILYVASANALNRKGLADFLRLAWPAVRRAIPAADLMLAGDIGATLVADVPGVTRLGRVADLSPLYGDARVVINPGVAGTGLKIKTLEALGHFRTVVSWPSGVEGLPPELAARCVVVQDWYAFAQQLVRLLSVEPAPSFSADQRAAIRRLMAPDIAYSSLTDAVEALMRERSGILARPEATSVAQARG
jgi:hypothetical protein